MDLAGVRASLCGDVAMGLGGYVAICLCGYCELGAHPQVGGRILMFRSRIQTGLPHNCEMENTRSD